MLHFQTFIGGIFETNAYLIQTPDGNIMIDAPTGSLDWIQKLGVRVDLLLITHGHVDHFDDAAKIKRASHCQVAFHKDGIPLMTDPDFFKKLGFNLEAESVQPDFLIEETPQIQLCGVLFRVRFARVRLDSAGVRHGRVRGGSLRHDGFTRRRPGRRGRWPRLRACRHHIELGRWVQCMHVRVERTMDLHEPDLRLARGCGGDLFLPRPHVRARPGVSERGWMQ